jgi:Zn-dependent protease
VLAVAGSGVAWGAWLFGSEASGTPDWLWLIGGAFTEVNLVLLFFNLLPIPPLDGSSVFPLFLSNRGLLTYYRLRQYGFAMLIALLWGVPAVFGIDLIGVYFRHTVDPLFNLLMPLARR